MARFSFATGGAFDQGIFIKTTTKLIVQSGLLNGITATPCQHLWNEDAFRLIMEKLLKTLSCSTHRVHD